MLIHSRVEGHVDAPIEQSWQFVRDIRTVPLWHVAVVAVRDVVGTLDEVGSTATLVLKLPDGVHDFHAEVTDVEPGRLMAHRGRQVDGPARYTSAIRYVPAGRGFDWTWEQDYEIPDGLPGPLGSEAFVTAWTDQVLRQSGENSVLLLEAMAGQPV